MIPTILVIEDNTLNLEAILEALERLGLTPGST
jgi:CheY-like chemotaxis protein